MKHVFLVHVTLVCLMLLASGCHYTYREPGERGTLYQYGAPPVLVRESCTTRYPDSKIGPTEKATHQDGAIHWRVKLTTKDGQEKTLEYDKDGRLVSER